MSEAETRIDRGTPEALADLVAPSERGDVGSVCGTAADASSWLAGLMPPRRASLLRRIVQSIERHRVRLVALADQETGLGTGRLDGELIRSIGQVNFLADVVEVGSRWDATIKSVRSDEQSPGTPDLRRMMLPLGPVTDFSASNFPFAFSVLGGDVASALAARCPVVVEALPGHPETWLLSMETIKGAITATGGESSVVGLVAGREVGTDLVRDSRICAVGFTGSTSRGVVLAGVAAARPEPIPFSSELGSITPLAVTLQAARSRPDELATGIAGSSAVRVGQVCTKPGIALIPEGPGGNRLRSSVAEQSADVDPTFMLTRSIHSVFSNGSAELGRIAGVAILTDVASGIDRLSAGAITAPASLVLNADSAPERAFRPRNCSSSVQRHRRGYRGSGRHRGITDRHRSRGMTVGSASRPGPDHYLSPLGPSHLQWVPGWHGRLVGHAVWRPIPGQYVGSPYVPGCRRDEQVPPADMYAEHASGLSSPSVQDHNPCQIPETAQRQALRRTGHPHDSAGPNEEGPP